MLPTLFGQAIAAPIRVDTHQLIEDARHQVGVTLTYDSAYRRLNYPNGDVPANTGVCADVIVRAFRGQNLDLQKLLHEDMRQHFDQYPSRWGLKKPDANIDHRRVPNLMAYFSRRGNEIAITRRLSDYRPGDIVTWNLNPKGSLPHIGIVSDKKTLLGEPLIIHNIGSGTREEAILFEYLITGHYRF